MDNEKKNIQTYNSVLEQQKEHEGILENLKRCKDQRIKEIKQNLSLVLGKMKEDFEEGQKWIDGDKFLLLPEKNRQKRKRQESYDQQVMRKKEESEKQIKSLEKEVKLQENKEEERRKSFKRSFEYECFEVISGVMEERKKEQQSNLEEIEQKKKKREEIELQILKLKNEFERLGDIISREEIERQKISEGIDTLKVKNLKDAYVEEKVRLVQRELEKRVNEGKIQFDKDKIKAIIRYLKKEINKRIEENENNIILSFDIVKKWINDDKKGENEDKKDFDQICDILNSCGLLVEKEQRYRSIKDGEKISIATNKDESKDVPVINVSGSLVVNSKYEWEKRFWKEKIQNLKEQQNEDIDIRIEAFENLGFEFLDKQSFKKQIETARAEGVDLISDIDLFLLKYCDNFPGLIVPRNPKELGKSFFKANLDGGNRNPRILMEMGIKKLKILCVCPHVNYDRILHGEIKNYQQIWKGDWTLKGKQGKKTGRA